MNALSLKFVLLMFLSVTYLTSAQVVKVTGVKQITDKNDGDYFISGVSPDGKQLLISEPNYKGLYLMSLKGRSVVKITDDAGAGFEPSYSPGGESVYYRSDDFSGNRKLSSISRYDVASGSIEVMEKMGRDISSPRVEGARLVYRAAGTLKSLPVSDAALKNYAGEIYVVAEELVPVVYINGERKELKPGGEGAYLWVSLSPDKTKILYRLAGKGTFVCDLEGTILKSCGRINAPKWLTDDIVIGMDDKDDGYQVTSSDLVAYSLVTDQKQYITSTGEMKEMYPVPFPDGKKIAFQTTEGELFVLKLRIK